MLSHKYILRFSIQVRANLRFAFLVIPPKNWKEMVKKDIFLERNIIYVLLYPGARKKPLPSKSERRPDTPRFVAIYLEDYISTNNRRRKPKKVKWRPDLNDFFYDVANIAGNDAKLEDNEVEGLSKQFEDQVSLIREEAISRHVDAFGGMGAEVLCLPDIQDGRLSRDAFYEICNFWYASRIAPAARADGLNHGTSVVPATETLEELLGNLQTLGHRRS
jgi:hypothetical protein